MEERTTNTTGSRRHPEEMNGEVPNDMEADQHEANEGEGHQ